MASTSRPMDLLLYEPARSLMCPICLEPFVNPVCLQCCGNTYCTDCITVWLDCSSGNCPACESPATVPSSTCKVVVHAIDALEVCCPHAQKGCSYTFPYGELDHHLASVCQKVDVHCPFACLGCPVVLPRDELDKHIHDADEHVRHIKMAQDARSQLNRQQQELEESKAAIAELRGKLTDAQKKQNVADNRRSHWSLPPKEMANLFNRTGENNWNLPTAEPGMPRLRSSVDFDREARGRSF